MVMIGSCLTACTQREGTLEDINAVLMSDPERNSVFSAISVEAAKRRRLNADFHFRNSQYKKGGKPVSRNGWFNYDADDAFYIEEHVEGKLYGPEALLIKLKADREALFKKTAEKYKTCEPISNFDLIRNEILSRRADVSFDKALLATLTAREKAEVDEMLIREILNHNPTCYHYIDCLDSVKKLDRKFIATLTGNSRYDVLKGIYLVNRSGMILRELARAARRQFYCFDLLADIYSATKEARVYKIITKIYAQKKNDPAYEFVAQTKLSAPEKKQAKTGSRESRIFYLDKDNRITDASHAHKRVIQVLEDGVLVDEVWSYISNEEEIEMHEMECVYVDESGQEVPQEKAVSVIYKTLKDGKVISETKYELSKSAPKL